jgi:hypothetical protein
LEQSHREELVRMDRRHKEIINQLQEERSKRRQVQQNNESLARLNAELSVEKQHLAQETKSLQDRLMEMQKMIPMLLADRDKLAMQSLEYSYAVSTAHMQSPYRHQSLQHSEHEGDVRESYSKERHRVSSPISLPRPSIDKSVTPTHATKSPTASAEAPPTYESTAPNLSPESKLSSSHLLIDESPRSTSVPAAAENVVAETREPVIEFPQLNHDQVTAEEDEEDDDEEEQRLLARIAYIHQLQETKNELERSLSESVFGQSALLDRSARSNNPVDESKTRSKHVPSNQSHGKEAKKNLSRSKSSPSPANTQKVDGKSPASTKVRAKALVVRPSTTSSSMVRKAEPNATSVPVHVKKSRKPSPATKIIIHGYRIDPSAVTLIPTASKTSASLHPPATSTTVSDTKAMKNAMTTSGRRGKISMNIPQVSRSSHEISDIAHYDTEKSSTISYSRNPLFDMTFNGYHPSASLSQSLEDLRSQTPTSHISRYASPSARSTRNFSSSSKLRSNSQIRSQRKSSTSSQGK